MCEETAVKERYYAILPHMNLKIRRRLYGPALFTLSLLIFALYAAHAVKEGGLIAPLDDAYIHFQYARQASAGEVWRYNSGQAVTTGATSLLYPFLLAIGFWLGVADHQIAGVALAIGYVSFFLSAVILWRWGERLLRDAGRSPAPALLLPLIFIGSGAVQWAYFNGMETGLYTLSILASLYAFYRENHYRAAAAIVLAAFIRPEGAFLAAILGFTFILASWPARRSEERRRLILLAAILSLSAAPYLLNYLATGEFLSSGAQAKSWFNNQPFRAWDIIRSVARNFLTVLERATLGMLAPEAWPIPVGVLPLSAVGWVYLVKKERWPVSLLSLLWTAAGLALSATLITATWHVGRYQIPYVVSLYPPALVGVIYLGQRMGRFGPAFLAAAGVATALVALWTTGEGVDKYAQATASIHDLQMETAVWIKQNLPPDAYVAIVDAGVIRYAGERPTLDLIGLTSRGFAPLWRSGIGAVYERMEASPRRPTHIAVFPHVSTIPYLAQTDLFHEEIHRVEAPDYSSVGAVESTKVIYKTDWSRANRGNELQQPAYVRLAAGLRPLARIDVAHAASEEQVEFRWWEGETMIGHVTDLQQLPYNPQTSLPSPQVLDGGRLLTGGAAFTVETRPGHPLTLFARTHNVQPNGFEVFVDGTFAGTWRQPARPGEWVESSFIVAGEHIGEHTSRVRLVVSNRAHYVGLYHLWVFEGRPAFETYEAATPLHARFGGGPELAGYTVDVDASAVNVDLVWGKSEKSRLDAKVFVHLYGSAGDLVTQHDGYPAAGARPPYTWHVGEQILDPHTLPLPPDLPGGAYELMVGLYRPHEGGRIPIEEGGGREKEDDRLWLTTIRIGE